jgi:hypothetical protein
MNVMTRGVLFALALGASQITESRPAVFGSVALTELELAQIGGLAEKPAWLVLGYRSMIRGVATVSVYLRPDVVGTSVERGRMLSLVADDPPVVPNRSAWKIRDTVPYACIALPDRRCNDIFSERDRAWPFLVQGDLDDDTLISVVTFLRSMPRLQLGTFSITVGTAPIAGLSRQDDAIIVSFRMVEQTIERITLVKKDGQWVMTDYGMVIA